MDDFKQTEIKNLRFCALDFETTQIMGSPGALAIIEIGAQHFTWDGVQGDPFETLVNPKCNIRPFDTGVSGISDRMVADEPFFTDVFPHFSSYIKDRVIFAHNASFDQRALRSQCEQDQLDNPENIFIDSAALLKKTVTLPKYRLEDAIEHFKLGGKPLHRALSDSLVVADLSLIILNIAYSERGIRTLDQLCNFLGTGIQPQAEQTILF